MHKFGKICKIIEFYIDCRNVDSSKDIIQIWGLLLYIHHTELLTWAKLCWSFFPIMAQ